jgi:dTDP-L-rhamnose 4-epimerase
MSSQKNDEGDNQKLVLITGGAGFIGSHTADALLQAGYRVRILDCLDPQIHGPARTFPSYLPRGIECILGDVRNETDLLQALGGVSFVFHFASLTGVGQSMYDIKHYADVNVTGTANILETIVKHKFPIRKFVLSSSRAVYGEGTHTCSQCGLFYPPVRKRENMEQGRFHIYCPKCGQKAISVTTKEDRPLLPISVYGWTKKLQEELCQYASLTFGLPTTILRYFNVYGSRQSLINPYTGIVSIFFSRLMASKPISLYEHGIPLRDFVHVSDVVQSNLKALHSKLSQSTAMNVGTGSAVTVRDIAQALAFALGREPQFEDNGEFRMGDICACVADISCAGESLGYKPATSLEAGMREFVVWAEKHQHLDLYGQATGELKSFGLINQTESEKHP